MTKWDEPKTGDRVEIDKTEYVITRVDVTRKGAIVSRAQIDLIPVSEAIRRRDNLTRLLEGVAAEEEHA